MKPAPGGFILLAFVASSIPAALCTFSAAFVPGAALGKDAIHRVLRGSVGHRGLLSTRDFSPMPAKQATSDRGLLSTRYFAPMLAKQATRAASLLARRRTLPMPSIMSASSGSWEDDMRAKALVSTEWLCERLGSSEICILDVRGEVGKEDIGGGQVVTSYIAMRDAYVERHVPGASFVDWTSDITDPDSKIPVQLASLDAFASAMEEKGVGTDKTIVCYDNGNMLFATRLWWALTRYGHRDVRVLDGGIKRWTLEGRATVADDGGCPLKVYSEWQAMDAMPGLCVSADAVRKMVSSGSKGGVLIDARSSEQFSGKQRRSLRSGHIPCAVSMPYKELIDTKRGGYLPQEQTRAILKAGSALPIEEGRVLLYCNGGVASTAVMFHLWQLGVPLARLSNYDGSIGEWGNQEDEEKFPLISD